MEETNWDAYGTGNYEKCADCMVHSGYEATAVKDAVAHPLKALAVSLRGTRTDGPMGPEIPLDRQRPAEYVFSRHVEDALARIHRQELERKASRANSSPLERGGTGDRHSQMMAQFENRAKISDN